MTRANKVLSCLVPTVAQALACGTCIALTCSAALAQKVEFAQVTSKSESRTVDLPGEFEPFLSVALHAKVQGYVDKVNVDRGSLVKQGDILVELSAPEMASRIVEAESRIQAAEADRAQAEAQLAATRSTYEKLSKAAETPGAIAGNELVQIQQQIASEQALIESRRQLSQAATANLHTLQELQSYLHIVAPFDGMITDRMIHPGALVGPGSDPPLLILQQLSKLRLVVAVPEDDSAVIPFGARVAFHVPAYPDKVFAGVIARSSHTIEMSTRTMAVELDVTNADGLLAPGMYPTVVWLVRQIHPSILVPATSVVTTTERTFVIRNRSGHAEWVDVKKGAAEGDQIEVFGELKAGDLVVKRASDEIRNGAALPLK